MKAEELRIGNWVDYNGTPVLVDSGTIRNMHLMGEHHQYQPIELSPEILEKAGFRKDVLGYHIVLPDRFNNYKELSVAYNNDDSTPKYYTYYREAGKLKDDRSGDSLVQLRHDLQYVHQLQNLFYSLVGSELPLNL